MSAANPGTDTAARLAAGLEGIEEVAFVFEAAPQPLDEDIVHPAAAPVHGDADAGIFSVVVKAKLVNCERWSVLKVSGPPWRVIASSRAATQKLASIVLDNRHVRTLRLNQSMMATR